MGSMSYYSNNYNPSLTSDSPLVIQALMIYVYSDRVTFQMKNYGEKFGTNAAPLSYTLMLDTGVVPNKVHKPEPTNTPVSYTHLDVYKRQENSGICVYGGCYRIVYSILSGYCRISYYGRIR